MYKYIYFIPLFSVIILQSAQAQEPTNYNTDSYGTPYITRLRHDELASIHEDGITDFPSTIIDNDCHVNLELSLRTSNVGGLDFSPIKEYIFNALLEKGYVLDTNSNKRISIISRGVSYSDGLYDSRSVGYGSAKFYMFNFPEQIAPTYYKVFSRKRMVVNYVPMRVFKRLVRRVVRIIPQCITR